MERVVAGGGARSKPPCRGGPGYTVWRFGVPEELDSALKQLAAEQRRSLPQQVIWLLQEAVRRERAQLRRASDEGRGGVLMRRDA